VVGIIIVINLYTYCEMQNEKMMKFVFFPFTRDWRLNLVKKAARPRQSACWRDLLEHMLELRWESKLVGSRLDNVKPLGEGFLAGEG